MSPLSPFRSTPSSHVPSGFSMRRLVPSQTCAGAGPCGPTGPCIPLSPFSPCGPCSPVSPLGPAGPTGPCAPVSPLGPAGPCGPRLPRNPCTNTVSFPTPGAFTHSSRPIYDNPQSQSGFATLFFLTSAMLSSPYENSRGNQLPRLFIYNGLRTLVNHFRHPSMRCSAPCTYAAQSAPCRHGPAETEHRTSYPGRTTA